MLPNSQLAEQCVKVSGLGIKALTAILSAQPAASVDQGNCKRDIKPVPF